MRCLIVSPIPTEPATQGNAVGIAGSARWLQACGYHIHMVYSAMEGASPDQIGAMGAIWDTLDVIPFAGITAEPSPRGYPLDAWFDPAVGDHVAALCQRWHFDLALVHYIWMSAALERLPPNVPRLLATHDRFGDRHLRWARAGIAPSWYSISVENEAAGLARADHIIAVQEEEAEYFRTLTDRPVHVFALLQALRTRPPRLNDATGNIAAPHAAIPRDTFAVHGRGRSGCLTAGYIGSDNPSNRRSILDVLKAIDRHPTLRAGGFRLVLAGPICAALGAEGERPYVERLGLVDSPDRVFEAVDVVINPSVGGTGIKIKSIEALASGMPLIATRDAMIGLPTAHHAHACQDMADIVDALAEMSEESALDRLTAASHTVAETYMRRQVAAFRNLMDSVRRPQLQQVGSSA